MSGGNDAPDPPDPRETSSAQTGTNVATAIANAILQNPNQTTPWGSIEYSFGQARPRVETYTVQRPSNSGSTVSGDPPSPFRPLTDEYTNNPDWVEQTQGETVTRYRVGDRDFGQLKNANKYAAKQSKGDTYEWTDPYTGETYSIPRISINQTLTEEGQLLQDRNTQTQLNLAQLAQDQSGFLQDYMAEPFEYNPGEHEGWALNLYEQLNGENRGQQQEAMESRLANQGIMNGSEAYSRAMEDFTSGQQNSRNKFLLDSYSTGMNTALTERNQPLNEISALLGGSQVQQPNFVNPNIQGIPTTDNASIIANDYAAQMNAWQQNQAASGSMLSGLGGLFQGLGSAGMIGGPGSGAMLALSDERAKTDKRKIGETEDGLGLYSFKYKGSPRTEIGLMAQEVKKKKPGAVETRADGLMAVDYGKALR